jgi:hypothetical protein
MTSHLTSAVARLGAKGLDNNHEVLPASVASMVEKSQHGVPRRFQHFLVMMVQKQHFIHVQHLSAQNPSWAARLRSASAPVHIFFQASHGKADQNQIRDKLHEFCEKAGLGNVPIEPRDYLSVCAVRPDLSVCFASWVHTVDVRGTETVCPVARRSCRRTLTAAWAREQTKITQYGPRF